VQIAVAALNNRGAGGKDWSCFRCRESAQYRLGNCPSPGYQTTDDARTTAKFNQRTKSRSCAAAETNSIFERRIAKDGRSGRSKRSCSTSCPQQSLGPPDRWQASCCPVGRGAIAAPSPGMARVGSLRPSWRSPLYCALWRAAERVLDRARVSSAQLPVVFPPRLTASCPLNRTLSVKSTFFFATTVSKPPDLGPATKSKYQRGIAIHRRIWRAPALLILDALSECCLPKSAQLHPALLLS